VTPRPIIVERPTRSLTVERGRRPGFTVERAPAREIVIQRFGLPGNVGGASGAGIQIDSINAVASGQTLFNLSRLPLDPSKVRMDINGTHYRAPMISVAAQQVTWGEAFTLDATDTVEFIYPT
jgi:hypothetical protein